MPFVETDYGFEPLDNFVDPDDLVEDDEDLWDEDYYEASRESW